MLCLNFLILITGLLLQIKDIMAKAQAVIEERKKAMANLQTAEQKPTTNGAGELCTYQLYHNISDNSGVCLIL